MLNSKSWQIPKYSKETGKVIEYPVDSIIETEQMYMPLTPRVYVPVENEIMRPDGSFLGSKRDRDARWAYGIVFPVDRTDVMVMDFDYPKYPSKKFCQIDAVRDGIQEIISTRLVKQYDLLVSSHSPVKKGTIKGPKAMIDVMRASFHVYFKLKDHYNVRGILRNMILKNFGCSGFCICALKSGEMVARISPKFTPEILKGPVSFPRDDTIIHVESHDLSNGEVWTSIDYRGVVDNINLRDIPAAKKDITTMLRE